MQRADYRTLLRDNPASACCEWPADASDASSFRNFVISHLEAKGFEFTVDLGLEDGPFDVRAVLSKGKNSKNFALNHKHSREIDTVFHLTKEIVDMNTVSAWVTVRDSMYLKVESHHYTQRTGVASAMFTIGLVLTTTLYTALSTSNFSVSKS